MKKIAGLLGTALAGVILLCTNAHSQCFQGTVDITNPAQQQTWYVGQTYEIKWTSTIPLATGQLWRLANVYYVGPEGKRYACSGQQRLNTGSCSWTVPPSAAIDKEIKIMIYVSCYPERQNRTYYREFWSPPIKIEKRQ